MRRGNNESTELPGQDSFLDIVANIVGILILLVMVVGVRASHQPISAEPAKPDPNTHATVDETQLRESIRQVRLAEHDLQKLALRVVNVHNTASDREDERLMLGTFVAAMEHEIQERRDELNEVQQQDFDVRRQLGEARATLDDLTREQIALVSTAPEVEEVEHLPTPLARTVNGDEIFFRLSGGRVAFIPHSELIAELRQHAEANVWQLRDRNEVANTIGPLHGFRLRYYMRKHQFTVRGSGGGNRSGTAIQFTRWELLPVSPSLGEVVDQAVMPGSNLLQFLEGYPPSTTTVTVWIYPDSFSAYGTLKRALYERGYGCAARPLPAGVRIGGSPRGTKTKAQ